MSDIYAGYSEFEKYLFRKFDNGFNGSGIFWKQTWTKWLKIKQLQAQQEAAKVLEEIETPPVVETPKTPKEKLNDNITYLIDFVNKIQDILKVEVIPGETDNTTLVDIANNDNTLVDSENINNTNNTNNTKVEDPESPNTERKETSIGTLNRIRLYISIFNDDTTLEIFKDTLNFVISYKKIALLRKKIEDETKTDTTELKKNELLIYMIPVLQEIDNYFTLSNLNDKVTYLKNIFENYTPFVLQNIDNNQCIYFSYNLVDFKISMYYYVVETPEDSEIYNEGIATLNEFSGIGGGIANPEPPKEEVEEDLTIPETQFYLNIEKKMYDNAGEYIVYKTYHTFDDKTISNLLNYIDKLWLINK